MREEPSPPPSVHLALIGVQVMFASLSVVAKIALREIGPFGLVAFRVTAAALALFSMRLFARGGERVALRDLPELAAYALFGVVCNQLLFINGLLRTTATNAVVIGSTIPVLTVGVAVLARKEAATPSKITGLAIALVGALGIVGAGQFHGGGRQLTGNLLVLCNSLSYSIYLVISRRLLARYRTLTVISFVFVFGAIGVLPFGAPELLTRLPHLSTTAWLALAYIVVFPTMGTYFLNSFALKRAASSLVAIYIYLQPVLGALLAHLVLGERLTASTAAGGLFIGLGIWLVTRGALRIRPASPAA